LRKRKEAFRENIHLEPGEKRKMEITHLHVFMRSVEKGKKKEKNPNSSVLSFNGEGGERKKTRAYPGRGSNFPIRKEIKEKECSPRQKESFHFI